MWKGASRALAGRTETVIRDVNAAKRDDDYNRRRGDGSISSAASTANRKSRTLSIFYLTQSRSRVEFHLKRSACCTRNIGLVAPSRGCSGSARIIPRISQGCAVRVRWNRSRGETRGTTPLACMDRYFIPTMYLRVTRLLSSAIVPQRRCSSFRARIR